MVNKFEAIEFNPLAGNIADAVFVRGSATDDEIAQAVADQIATNRPFQIRVKDGMGHDIFPSDQLIKLNELSPEKREEETGRIIKTLLEADVVYVERPTPTENPEQSKLWQTPTSVVISELEAIGNEPLDLVTDERIIDPKKHGVVFFRSLLAGFIFSGSEGHNAATIQEDNKVPVTLTPGLFEMAKKASPKERDSFIDKFGKRMANAKQIIIVDLKHLTDPSSI